MSDPGADDQDYKWLVARERGENIGDVPPAERAPYDQLGELLGRGVAPSAGFRQRVLDAIDAAEAAGAGSEARPRLEPPPARAAEPELAPVLQLRPKEEPRERQQKQQTSRRWLAVGGALAAAAAIVVFAMRPGRQTGPELAVAGTIERGATAMRAERTSEEAILGDTLAVRAEASGPAEVRVYGGTGGQLLARCDDHGGQDGCQIEHDGERRRFSLSVPLNAPGKVRTVIFGGASVPPSQGSLDQDLEAAGRAHLRYELGKQVWTVR